MNFKIGKNCVFWNVYVVWLEFGLEGILGIDFLISLNLDLGIKDECLIMDG